MSQSAEEDAAELALALALKYGRCPVCDGVKCFPADHVNFCTCCLECGNHEANSCVCCKHCIVTLVDCNCFYRISAIWDKCIECGYCEDCCFKVVHQKGEHCPLCCAYCKNVKHFCTCCKKCGTTPCICCVDCGELHIKCKCWSAKVLSHFMRRAVHYHKMQQQLHVCPCPNTRVLLMVRDD